MANFSAGLLELPAATAAATIALGYLTDATAAAARLSDKSDKEALHDFRVALRRLRVTLRGYPAANASLSKKQRAKLRKLARYTNSARDAEVQLAWFRERKTHFTRAQHEALSRLRSRLRAHRRRRVANTTRKLQRSFSRFERKVRRRLEAMPTRVRDRQPPFRGVAASAIILQAADLGSRLGKALTETSPLDLHTTRIAAKRLRYLLEPVAPGAPDGDVVLERLKVLQELLGVLTDGHELEATLEDEDVETATPVLERLRDEREAAISQLREEWRQAGSDLARQLDRIARQLVPAAKTPPSMLQRPQRRRRKRAAV